MTVQDMHYEFKLRYNEVDTQDRKDYNVAEIDAFLADAALVKAKLEYRNAEADQGNTDALSTIVVTSPTANQGVVSPFAITDGIYEFKMSDFSFDYMHMYRAEVKVEECTDKLSLVIVQHDDLQNKLTNFHEAPSLQWRRALGVIGRSSDNSGQSIYVYSNGVYTISGLYPTYLRRPAEITIGGYIGIDGVTTRTQTECDLPEYIHTEVVDLAVQNALGIVSLPHEHQVAQLKTQLNN